jgi:16S rRNA (cytosine1402-N4)-methyltransferase
VWVGQGVTAAVLVDRTAGRRKGGGGLGHGVGVKLCYLREGAVDEEPLSLLCLIAKKRSDLPHVPVLLPQVLDVLGLREDDTQGGGKIVVDCTLGLGGHSAAMLERLGEGGMLIGIDLDGANLALARARLKHVRTRATFQLFQTNFAGIENVLAKAGVALGSVDGVLADVGIASTQIDDPARGFSYRRPGPLDMRMDPTRGQPASALLQRMSEREIADALLELGDETDAPQIAKLIVQRRAATPIETTQDLMAIVCEARDFTIARAAGAKLHPAARTFQALRILVNRELANLDRLLTVLPSVLKPGGIAAIISFHSGEDRRVKYAFRDGFRDGIYAAENRDPIVADEFEREENPRARSAKLRWAKRA